VDIGGDDEIVDEGEGAGDAVERGAGGGGGLMAPTDCAGPTVEGDDAAAVSDDGAGDVLAGGAGEDGVGGGDGRAPRKAEDVGGPQLAAVARIEGGHAAEVGTADVENAVGDARGGFDPGEPVGVAPACGGGGGVETVEEVVARADDEAVADDDGRGDEGAAQRGAEAFAAIAAMKGKERAVEAGGDEVIALQGDGRVDRSGGGVAPHDAAGLGVDAVEMAVGGADVEDAAGVDDGSGGAVIEGGVAR
jgi:hypothetical protein